ncbi:hypothetical protein H5410_033784 [Solanum commersonii]|uniref:Uncharacterized protein n=1 Tax=Solanum commersonii TaxID=4109 RepID=A0A9J5YU40_SOLCO|nr:hypothetical protein H5410_033784 [Solanum commersonii]
MSPKLYLLSCGGILEPKIPCEQILRGISIVKDKGHNWWTGKEDLMSGKLCYKLGISLIKRSGGNLEKDMLVCGLLTRHNWVFCIFLCLYHITKVNWKMSRNYMLKMDGKLMHWKVISMRIYAITYEEIEHGECLVMMVNSKLAQPGNYAEVEESI